MGKIAVINAPFDYPAGPRWTPLTANKVYSLQQDGDDTFTFQTRDYDRYISPAYSDPSNVIRSEVYGPAFPANELVTFTYTLTVQPIPPVPTPNAWLLFGQLHSGNDVAGASPCLSLNVLSDGHGGETLFVNLNHRGQGETAFHYDVIGSMPFRRGVAYRVMKQFIDSRGGSNGLAKVTINDMLIANYAGRTGYFGQLEDSYSKFGIYTGGKGKDVTAIPDPNQRIVASYFKPIFTRGG